METYVIDGTFKHFFAGGSSRDGRFLARLLVLCVLATLVTSCGRAGAPELEVLPTRFLLRPGEQIHYSILEHTDKGLRAVDYAYSVQDPDIVRPIEPKWVLEAMRPGRTELVVRTSTAERRISIEVAGDAVQPMMAVPHRSVQELVGKEFLFVGHANLDGFDHTAVAKPGIDQLVQEAKKNGVPVVYFVSKEYPNWYTEDRHPNYAIVSEGQEHQIHVDAERVTFAGGSFMFCTLRNAQMSPHGMIKHDARRIHFVFPVQAIWVEDLWGPGEKRPFPAPTLVLTTLFSRRANDAQAYDEVVVPFLDRMITQFPVVGYPPDPPSPPLSDLLKDWSIVVRFADRFERVYRRGNPNKTLLVEFQGN